MNKYRSLYNTTLSRIINLLLVMVCFILCRVIFLIENLKAFSDLSAGRIWRMFEGGFLFDTSAILYTNLLYIFLMLIPLHYKENGLRGKWEGEKRKKWKAVIKIPRPDLTFRYSARFHV